MLHDINVIGSEKRDHFALNAKFAVFQTQSISYRLHSWFTCSSGLNMFEATPWLRHEMAALLVEGENGRF